MLYQLENPFKSQNPQNNNRHLCLTKAGPPKSEFIGKRTKINDFLKKYGLPKSDYF